MLETLENDADTVLEASVPSLRPTALSEFTGQERIKANLSVFINAARQRSEALDHVLLWGPPGLGKTTLANIVAREMGVNIKATSGPVLERVGDLAAILTSLSDGDVLFIDEIHRLQKVVEEALYPAMEEYKLDIIIGEGPNARIIKLNLPRFTLVGATTRSGLLSAPLRDRFGIPFQMEFYSPEELVVIVSRSAHLLEMPLTEDAGYQIAKRSRGTPRIANRILKRIRDFAQVAGKAVIDSEIVELALAALNIDRCGLDEHDCKLLMVIIERFGGGPAGVDAISAALREDRDTIEDVYEPYLLQEGLLERTSKGRVVTEKAYRHFGIAVSAKNS
jgi:Holliday junction DNA helicase RuvB